MGKLALMDVFLPSIRKWCTWNSLQIFTATLLNVPWALCWSAHTEFTALFISLVSHLMYNMHFLLIMKIRRRPFFWKHNHEITTEIKKHGALYYLLHRNRRKALQWEHTKHVFFLMHQAQPLPVATQGKVHGWDPCCPARVTILTELWFCMWSP